LRFDGGDEVIAARGNVLLRESNNAPFATALRTILQKQARTAGERCLITFPKIRTLPAVDSVAQSDHSFRHSPDLRTDDGGDESHRGVRKLVP
jgi:hypothetical protein